MVQYLSSHWFLFLILNPKEHKAFLGCLACTEGIQIFLFIIFKVPDQNIHTIKWKILSCSYKNLVGIITFCTVPICGNNQLLLLHMTKRKVLRWSYVYKLHTALTLSFVASSLYANVTPTSRQVISNDSSPDYPGRCSQHWKNIGLMLWSFGHNNIWFPQ